jgi:hypothetical protein
MRQIGSAGVTRSGPFPDMKGVMAGWTRAMTFRKITDEMQDGEISKTATDYPFEGVFEPMTPQRIFFKPEGQRAWRWWMLWTRTDYSITVGDNIVDYNGLKFRVMAKSDWSQGGYVQYDLVQDYVERT